MPTAPPGSSAPGSSAPGGFTPPTPEELSVLLPQYEITAVLGIGGMGAVYKGRQPKLARDVAIKVLPADATGSEGDEAFNFAERFQREAQAMARLHHQRIISVHDFGEATTEEGKPLLYIVMEFVEGTDLAHLVANESLTSDQMLAVVTQICDALHYAHEQGIVHRDIKPANIMLDVEGNVKVADFGLAKLTGGDAAAQSQLTMTNMAMGTPDYVSPEQLEQGREVDNRADIYSLGVMIYEMLTGAVPRGAFLPPSEKSADDLDPRLDEVVLKAMQADPETRYQQVSQLWTEVEQIRTTPRPVANTLHTGRVPVMGGGTGKVQILTGDTGRVAAKPASTATQLPVKEPMDPAKKKKIITVSLVSTISLLVLGALAYLILAPTPTTDDNLAAAETPTISAETPDKALAGRPDPHETPTTTNSRSLRSQDAPNPSAPLRPSTNPASAGSQRAQTPTTTQTPTTAPTPTPPPNPEPGTPNPQPLASGEPISLLPLVDIPQDRILGKWSRSGTELLCENNNTGMSRLALPARPSGSYRLTASFTRMEGEGAIGLHLPLGEGRETTCLFDHSNASSSEPSNANRTHVSGIEWVDGETVFSGKNPARRLNTPLETGRRYSADVGVTFTGGDRVTIDVRLDDRKHLHFEGDLSRLSIYEQFSQGEKADLPGLIVGNSTYAIHELTITPLEGGDITLLRPPPSPASTTSTPTLAPPPDAATFAGNRYKYFNERLRWAVAAARAKELGGYLVSIHSSEENAFVRSLLPPNPSGQPWIGLRPQDRDDQPWAWEDGTTTANFSVWKNRTRPAIGKSDGTENRAAIRAGDGNWGAVAEGFSGPYLVEWGEPANLPASTTTTEGNAPSLPPSPPTAPQTEAGQKIAALLEDARKTFNDTLGKAHAAKITTLNTNYRGALDRETKKVAATGNLDILLAWRSEIEALDALETGTPLHSPLHANAGDELEGMRATYRETIELYEGNRDSDAAPLVAALDKSLDALQREFTQARKIEDALEVRNFREQLETTGSALLNSALPVTTPQSGNQKSEIKNQESFTPLATPPPTDIDLARAAGTRGKLHAFGHYEGNDVTVPGHAERLRDIVVLRKYQNGWAAIRGGGEFHLENGPFSDRVRFASIDHGTMHNIANVTRDGELLLRGSIEVTKQKLGAPAVHASSHGDPGLGAVLLADGRILSWRIANNEAILEAPPIALPACTALVSTHRWLVALGQDGRPYAWHPTEGPPVIPASIKDIVALAPGSDLFLALDKDGKVHAYGSNRAGQKNVAPDLQDVVAIRAGGDTSAALKSDGTWVAWGSETHGVAEKIRTLSGVSDLQFFVTHEGTRSWLYWTE